MLYSALLCLGAASLVSSKISAEQRAVYNLRSDSLSQDDFTRQPYIANGYIGQRIPGTSICSLQRFIPC